MSIRNEIPKTVFKTECITYNYYIISDLGIYDRIVFFHFKKII